MVIRKTGKAIPKKGSGTAKKAPATKKTPAARAKPAGKSAAKAVKKTKPSRPPVHIPPKERPAPVVKGPDPAQERLKLLQQEKSELQDIIRRLRAERDSALAEGTRLGERVRELEADNTRRSTQEPQQAGPGGFDPTVDLEEDGTPTPEDDFDGTAGFFDRMDELRARRIELDRERNDRELEQSEQPFWMVCPKCGESMEEQESENVKLERCDTCGGLYLDRGEVDLLLSLMTDRDGQRRIHNILKF